MALDLEHEAMLSCALGSLTDHVKLQIAQILVDSIQTTNTPDELEHASKALFDAQSALHDEWVGEMVKAIQTTPK